MSGSSGTTPRSRLRNQFTAIGLFRRYYLKSSLIQANPNSAAKSAVILASKIEEVNVELPKILRDLDITKEGRLTRVPQNRD